jgi:hypothetical protein
MSSVISTAVQQNCAPTNALTIPVPAVTQAIDVFNSYCARSTELIWCMYHCNLSPRRPYAYHPPDRDNSTATSTPPVTSPPPTSLRPASTAPPSSSASPSSPAESPKNSVPVAAIAAPVVIGVLAIAGVVGLLFWMRRRRNGAKSNPHEPPQPEHGYPTENRVSRAELPGYEVLPEMPGGSVKYQHEMEVRPAELADHVKR